MRFYYLFGLLITLLVGCTAAATPEITPEVTESPYAVTDSICLVTDVGTISDGTFNQYAHEGMTELNQEFSGITTNYIETVDPENYTINIQQCLDFEADIIVTVGFTLTEATLAAAVANPDVYFIGVDQNVAALIEAPDNFAGIQAAEHEAGFLVGVITATVANDIGGDVVAGVYGIDVPAVKRFRNGYEQGALYINPDWEVGTNILGQYTDSFVDMEQGASIAQDYIDQGAVVIFGAGGLTGSGAILEAASQGIYVIGVDQDEYNTTFTEGTTEGSEFLITSAIKRVDRGVFDVAAMLFSGQVNQFPGSDNYLLNVITNGVGFAPAHDSDITDETLAVASEVYGLMLNGELETGVDPITGELLETAEATPESD